MTKREAKAERKFERAIKANNRLVAVSCWLKSIAQGEIEWEPYPGSPENIFARNHPAAHRALTQKD